MSMFKKVPSFSKGSILGGLAGGLVAGPVGAAVGGLAGGYASYSADQDAKKQKKALAKANAYDLYTWDLANKYNDPSAQMARLKAAGLNPNLVYQSGNVTGNTTSTPSSNGIAAVTRPDYIGKGLAVMQGFAALRNTNTQNELLNYQMGQTAAQTALTEQKTRDLKNFLDGNGPTTYGSHRGPVATPSVPEPTVEDDVIELAPKNARRILRRIMEQGKKGVADTIGFLSGDYAHDPVKIGKQRANEYIYKKSLDKLLNSGKISKQEYLRLYYFGV